MPDTIEVKYAGPVGLNASGDEDHWCEYDAGDCTGSYWETSWRLPNGRTINGGMVCDGHKPKVEAEAQTWQG